MSTGKVVLGTVAGLAIGGILGILFAPEKGSVTRQKIADKGHDYADSLKSKYNELADSVKETIQSVKKEAQNFSKDGEEKYDTVKSGSKDPASNY
ncbi:MAG TPA: YtxH domain-containing protein [Flavobacterium sp.]